MVDIIDHPGHPGQASLREAIIKKIYDILWKQIHKTVYEIATQTLKKGPFVPCEVFPLNSDMRGGSWRCPGPVPRRAAKTRVA